MTDDRDPYLAGQIARSVAPDHGPAFWAELDDSLAAAAPAVRSERRWRTPRILGVAASLLFTGSVVTTALARGGEGPTLVETGPAGVTSSVPSSTPTTSAGPDGSASSTTTTVVGTTTLPGEPRARRRPPQRRGVRVPGRRAP